MKKAILSMAFLSMMCAGRVYSVDVMTHDAMKDPVMQTAPATLDPKIDSKMSPIDKKIDPTVNSTLKDDSGVKTLDNFHDATDFVAPVDAE